MLDRESSKIPNLGDRVTKKKKGFHRIQVAAAYLNIRSNGQQKPAVDILALGEAAPKTLQTA